MYSIFLHNNEVYYFVENPRNFMHKSAKQQEIVSSLVDGDKTSRGLGMGNFCLYIAHAYLVCVC